MARDVINTVYIVVLSFTIIFAIVQLGLSSDLIWELNRHFFGFGGLIRPRTRYLVFCSTWGILAGILLLMFVVMHASMIVQVIVMFISMVLWLLGAALFTSAIGGSGLNCGPGFPNCFVVNIVNATMAFAWINWSFITIGFFLALWLVFFGREEDAHHQEAAGDQMRTNPASGPLNTSGTNPRESA